MSARADKNADCPAYHGGHEYIADELSKLDLILKRQIHEFRSQLQEGNNHIHQHMFISHEEIDEMFREPVFDDASRPRIEALDGEIAELERRIADTVTRSEEQHVDLPLLRLARLFNLSKFEIQALLICLAPELRRKYDRIYAYLQDDITRKRPSVDLVLNLLSGSEEERWRLQQMFTPHGVLLQAGLLQPVDDPHSPSGCSALAQFLRIDPRIRDFIMGCSVLEPRLRGFIRLRSGNESSPFMVVDAGTSRLVSDLIAWRFADQSVPVRNLVIHLYGPEGVGKQSLALEQCRRLQCNLLYLDLTQLMAVETDCEEFLRLAFREAMLLQAPLYIHSVDALINDDVRGRMLSKMLARLVREYGWLTFCAGEKPWQPTGLLDDTVFKSFELPLPDFESRKQAWEINLTANGEPRDGDLVTQLASQFLLTPGQIRAAADSIKLERALGRKQGDGDNTGLLQACRNQSNQKLRDLAVKVESRYDWKDLILPDNKLDSLQQICDQVRQQYKVFSQWGFDRKLAYGKGLSALFSGPPGTGKTMAAQVIAAEVELDLYKIDLSTVISKYIGETERNLSQIFKEAETSNAILFFDEADALFGKRTEVNDAHDRYANIEVSYLLQKMEEYKGIVILASNFRVNMDEAFVRRIRFIIEFPFPDEESRRQIWKIHFPEQAPVADDIDYDLLAGHFTIPGGNIKNVILNAAFRAAKTDSPISMAHLLEGTRHEYEKIGKSWTDGTVTKLPAKQAAR